MRGVERIVLVLLIAGASPDSARAWEQSRCADVEAPAAPGKPHIFIPPGVTVRTGPLEAADLARGERKGAVVTCVEWRPPMAGVESGVQAEAVWVVHLEAPHSTIVRGADGSCSASHQMVTISDGSGRFVASSGIGQKCKIRPHDLKRGR
jgi:hypothetical protein